MAVESSDLRKNIIWIKKKEEPTIVGFFDMKMKVSEILNRYNREEALLILEKLFKKTNLDLFLLLKEELTEEQELEFFEIEKRLEVDPLQYIVGFSYFFGRKFKVSPHVLIPRWDSEILVETVLEHLEKGPILEIGIGSGALSTTISLEKDLEVDGIDISLEAIQLAEENSNNLKGKTNFWHSDLFEKVDNKYEIIFSNPPYIKNEEIKNLEKKVQKEPRLALDGGRDGLDFYREIIDQSPNHLKNFGFLIFEIGYDQKKAVSNLLKEKGFQNIISKKDLNGVDRLVMGQYIEV